VATVGSWGVKAHQSDKVAEVDITLLADTMLSDIEADTMPTASIMTPVDTKLSAIIPSFSKEGGNGNG
jgi:hypothetical protein